MNKIGFVNICHEDYVDDNAIEIARMSVEALRAHGLNVYAVETPVTNFRNAEQAGRDMLAQCVDGVILFMGTWMECPNAMSVIREIEHLPMCLWGFGMFEKDGLLESTGSYVSFAMFKGVMDRIGYRYKAVLGTYDDTAVIGSVISFCKAAYCIGFMKRSRVGLIGYTSMGIYPGTFDHVLMRSKIGPEVVQTDSYTVFNLAAQASDDDTKATILWLKARARINTDVDDASLEKAARLTCALLRLCERDGLTAMNVKCQYEFSKEYGMVACVPVSSLSDMGIVGSCEGDMMNTVTMMILHLLSGCVVTYGDAINHEGNTVKLSSCGFIPFSMGVGGTQEIRRFMPHPGFSGIQNSFVLRPERVTVMRLIEEIGCYRIVYFTGQGQPTALRQGYMPALDVTLDGNVDDLVQAYSGQHYAICYGDVSKEIEDYGMLMDIKTTRI
jgi:L-fucose isomerase-like protein